MDHSTRPIARPSSCPPEAPATPLRVRVLSRRWALGATHQSSGRRRPHLGPSVEMQRLGVMVRHHAQTAACWRGLHNWGRHAAGLMTHTAFAHWLHHKRQGVEGTCSWLHPARNRGGHWSRDPPPSSPGRAPAASSWNTPFVMPQCAARQWSQGSIVQYV